MVDTILTLRSSIKPKAMQKALWQGCALGGSGVSLLLYAGTTYTPDSLLYWGLPIFLVAMGLIGWGLTPYKQLRRLEENPDKLMVDNKENIRFVHEGKPFLVVPASAVAKISYLDWAGEYGIVIHLHPGKKGRIYGKKMAKTQEVKARLWEQEGKRALFFPYFSERAYQLLIKNVTITAPEAEEPISWDKFRV